MQFRNKISLLLMLLALSSSVIFAQDRGADDLLVGWSPDGTQVAITSNRTGLAELYIIDTAGNLINHLFEGEELASAQWSPDGRLSVLLSNPNDENLNDLYLVTPDTGESTLLASISVSYGWIMLWSPDGHYIALYDPTTLLIVNTADGSVQDYGAELLYPRIEWSPNSQFIAVVSRENPDDLGENVFFYDVLSQTRSSNLLANYWKREAYCCLTFTAWSPDSTQLAIAVMNDANLYLSNVATQTLTPLVHTGGSIQALAWVSDGSAIYYHVGWRTNDFIPQEQLEGGRVGGIYRANIADRSIESISLSLGEVFAVDFSPNRQFFYSQAVNYGVGGELMSVGNLADGSVQPLQMNFFKVAGGLAWSPDGTSFAAPICETSEGDADIYLINPSTGSALNITQADAFTGEPQPSTCPGLG